MEPDRELIPPEDERRGSPIPIGQTDMAMLLSSLPQVSEWDCSLELDQLTMSGLNVIAQENKKTVEEVARDALYFYFRFYFFGKQAEAKAEQEDGEDG